MTKQKNLEKKYGMDRLRKNDYLRKIFRESLTPYEIALREEFGKQLISLEKICWLRWIEAVKCDGDPIRRMREYPSRPEESFMAAAETILDPNVMAKWVKNAEQEKFRLVRFEANGDGEGGLTVKPIFDDPTGKTKVWEEPDPKAMYVAGCDPSGGTENGDWFVCSVHRLDTGLQVAEFRSRMDPDMATDQVEALAYWYDVELLGVEANSYGAPVCKELYERGTVAMYQREIPDHMQPNKTVKKVGWVTNSNTRNFLMNEVRKAVREDRCRIRSQETLAEGRTLTVARTPSGLERIEAKQGCHDDGIFAYGIAILMRNRVMPDADDPELAAKAIEKEEVPELVQRLLELNRDPRYRSRLSYHHQNVRNVNGRAQLFPDGRRSAL